MVITKQYVAGFFDGEGYVGIAKGRFGYQLRIQVANTDYAILNIFKEKFGGYISIKHPKSAKHRISYTWTICSNLAFKFLKAIRPYVVVKRQQVDLAIAYQKVVGKHYRLTDSVIQERERVRRAISSLNGRRSVVTPLNI